MPTSIAIQRLVLPLFPLAFLAGCAVTDRQIISQADDFDKGLRPAVIQERDLNRYIAAVGDRIIDAAEAAHRERVGPKSHFAEESDWMFDRHRMKFHFVNSRTLNAFTTGGEHMYIYTELLQRCRSEHELATVMAHEYAHIYARHVQKGTQRQYAILGAALAAGAIGYAAGGDDNREEYALGAAGAVAVAGQLIGMNFTRKDEDQADQYGQIFYARAGYDPALFGNFFQIMVDLGYDKGPAYLSDHPKLSDRVATANKRAASLQRQYAPRPPLASDTQFRQLQRRATELARTLPDDRTLARSQELLRALPRSCLTPAIHEDQTQANARLQTMLEEDQKTQESAKKSKKKRQDK